MSKRNGIRKLGLKRETIRRLIADDLARVAGGRGGCCTYRYSGCVGGPSGVCDTTNGCETLRCESNCCL